MKSPTYPFTENPETAPIELPEVGKNLDSQ